MQQRVIAHTDNDRPESLPVLLQQLLIMSLPEMAAKADSDLAVGEIVSRLVSNWVSVPFPGEDAC